MTNKLIQNEINYLNKQKVSYLTQGMTSYIRDDKFTAYVTCPKDSGYVLSQVEFSKQLHKNLNTCYKEIRHVKSNSATDRLDYATWNNVPGTKNYVEKFYYKHILSPDAKYIIKRDTERIRRYRNTYKLNPDKNLNAPVYWVPSKIKLWDYKLVFIKDLVKRLKRL